MTAHKEAKVTDASTPDAPRKAEHLLADQGVFKGHDGLRQFAECASFWQQMPYGTRFHFDDNLPGRYLHHSVLRAAVAALDADAAQQAQAQNAARWVKLCELIDAYPFSAMVTLRGYQTSDSGDLTKHIDAEIAKGRP
jgi:hypothetical protein